jgi:hypothetical protein
MSWSLVQGVLPPVYRLENWNKAAKAHKGCGAIEKKKDNIRIHKQDINRKTKKFIK